MIQKVIMTLNPITGSPTFERIKALPKVETHLHIGGSFPLSFLLKQTTSQETIDSLKTNLKAIAERVDYLQAFGIFSIIPNIVDTKEKIEEGVFAICEEAKKDNVKKLELRTEIKKLKDGTDEEGYLLAVLKGMERANNFEFTAGLILSFKRNSSLEFVKLILELAQKYKDNGVIGFELSGNSLEGDIRDKLEILKKMKVMGLPFTAHMGESLQEEDQMIILKELQPDRIGHGVNLKEEAIKCILDKKIPVEVCLTSALLVKMHEADEVHPWLLGHKKLNHPITIATDDPSVFSTDLNKELYQLKKTFTIEQIEKIVENSFTYSFIK